MNSKEELIGRCWEEPQLADAIPKDIKKWSSHFVDEVLAAMSLIPSVLFPYSILGCILLRFIK